MQYLSSSVGRRISRHLTLAAAMGHSSLERLRRQFHFVCTIARTSSWPWSGLQIQIQIPSASVSAEPCPLRMLQYLLILSFVWVTICLLHRLPASPCLLVAFFIGHSPRRWIPERGFPVTSCIQFLVGIRLGWPGCYDL